MSNEVPKISVITVCLNEEQRINETICSIVNQEYHDFEWIVIDGGSTDGTLKILDQYRSRITKLISEQDQGVYDAMNKGIKIAQGEYCLFMNGGDKLYNRKSLYNFKNMEKKADINYGGIIEVHQGGKVYEKLPYPVRCYKYYLYRRCLPHQSSFIKRSLFQQYGLYNTDYKVNADWEFFSRVIVGKDVTVNFLQPIISVFYFDGLSSQTKGSQAMDQEVMRIRKKYYSIFYRVRVAVNILLSRFMGRPI